jgi:hypothetical protein
LKILGGSITYDHPVTADDLMPKHIQNVILSKIVKDLAPCGKMTVRYYRSNDPYVAANCYLEIPVVLRSRDKQLGVQFRPSSITAQVLVNDSSAMIIGFATYVTDIGAARREEAKLEKSLADPDSIGDIVSFIKDHVRTYTERYIKDHVLGHLEDIEHVVGIYESLRGNSTNVKR